MLKQLLDQGGASLTTIVREPMVLLLCQSAAGALVRCHPRLEFRTQLLYRRLMAQVGGALLV